MKKRFQIALVLLSLPAMWWLCTSIYNDYLDENSNEFNELN